MLPEGVGVAHISPKTAARRTGSDKSSRWVHSMSFWVTTPKVFIQSTRNSMMLQGPFLRSGRLTGCQSDVREGIRRRIRCLRLFVCLFVFLSFAVSPFSSPSVLSRMELQLWEAVYNGDLEEARRLLKTPTIDVNWRNHLETSVYKDSPPLYHTFGRTEEAFIISKMLLAHPDIDVNVKTASGETPFLRGLDGENELTIQEFLKDARVDFNACDNEGRSPMFWLGRIRYSRLQFMIASGREWVFGKPGDLTDPLVQARECGLSVVAGEDEAIKTIPPQRRCRFQGRCRFR